MADATIAEMARRKIFYVPTIDHNRYNASNYVSLKCPPKAVDGLNDFRAAHAMFGEDARELGWFVKDRMTAEQALRAATARGAEMLG